MRKERERRYLKTRVSVRALQYARKQESEGRRARISQDSNDEDIEWWLQRREKSVFDDHRMSAGAFLVGSSPPPRGRCAPAGDPCPFTELFCEYGREPGPSGSVGARSPPSLAGG